MSGVDKLSIKKNPYSIDCKKIGSNTIDFSTCFRKLGVILWTVSKHSSVLV